MTVTLTGADDRPGVVVEYRINGGEWKTYSAPVTIAPDGVHVFEYRATDAAGNRSAVGSKTLTIDKPSEVPGGPIGTVPPTLSLTLGAPATFGAFRPGVDGHVHRVHDRDRDQHRRRCDADGRRPERGPHRPARQRQLRAQPAARGARGHGRIRADQRLAAGAAAVRRPGRATPVTIGFRQSIAATEGLRTGAYGKTLTFTLSTTTP